MRLPIVFVFDLDATIMGNMMVLYQKSDLHALINAAIKTGKMQGKPLPPVRLDDHVNNELIRPGFADMIQNINKGFNNAEFFMFSAGNKEYVTQNIEWIEKRSGVKFRRPLLTHDNLVYVGTRAYRKSLELNKRIIIKALEHDYPAIKTMSNEVYNSRIVHIDDQNVLWEQNKTLICPEYKYKLLLDITKDIPMDILKHELVINFLADSHLLVQDSASSEEQLTYYYLNLGKTYAEYLPTNREALLDTFFSRLAKALLKYKNNKQPFTDAHIEAIRKTLTSGK